MPNTVSTPAPASAPAFIDRLLMLAVAMAALPVLGGPLGMHWLLDNLNAFAPQIAVALSLLAILALLRRRWRTSSVAIILVALETGALASSAGAGGSSGASGGVSKGAPALTWLVANVHTANRDHGALLAEISKHNPDAIGLVETDSRWLRALDVPLAGYPHRVLEPRPDNFGMALYSRVALHDAGLRKLGMAPTLGASVQLGGRPVELLLLHVVPPISGDWVAARNRQLERVATLRAPANGGLVVAGDFNATPYSTGFRGAFRADVWRRAGGLSGTFPAMLPSWLRIPIDHVLSQGEVHVTRKLGSAFGSDHLPLVVRMQMP